MEKTIRIMLVDDFLLVLEGFAKLLQEAAYIEVVGLVTSGEEALEKVVEFNPDVVLMDINLGKNMMNGFEATRQLIALVPEIQVLALTDGETPNDILQVRQSGAWGYVKKSASNAGLLAAINAVYHGIFVFPPDSGATVPPAALTGGALATDLGITPGQLKVLCAMTRCEFAIQAADELGISVRTVEAHLATLRTLLRCKKTSTLVKYAREHNLCP
jgi:DNA-binding NarL/FixJ family response regulator